MNRAVTAGVLAALLAAMGACAPRQPDAATNTAPAPDNSGDVNPEDPKAGTNTNRPDSIGDVKPEADGAKPN